MYHTEQIKEMKFYLEFEPCKECKVIVREFAESGQVETHENSMKFLRHITYNHEEIVQAIITEFPKEFKKQQFPWFV